MKNFVDLELKTNEIELSKIHTEIKILENQNSHRVNILAAEGGSQVAQVELEMKKMKQEFEKKKLDIDCNNLNRGKKVNFYD
jgi:hypothetical protein